jgi:acyl-homoserine-lactone acylase
MKKRGKERIMKNSASCFSESRFLWKFFIFSMTALLFLCACSPKGAEQTEILWDTWGVPHIFAEDTEGLFHAFGWAQMKSHGDLILRLYAEARGRAAEYWGESHIESDRIIHTLSIPKFARLWYESQKKNFQGYIDAFAAGMNAFAETNPDKIAEEVRMVLPVTGEDVMAHTLRVILHTFVGGGALPTAQRWQMTGSNAWAIAPSKSASGKAMLLANPHLSWSDFFLWYEAHFVLEELDAYGATLVGLPILGIAFTDHLGWTHTVNSLDGADLFELTLTEKGYLFDGEEKPFESADAVFKVRQEDGSLREERLTIHHSIHGPILARKGNKALAFRIVGLDQPYMYEQYWEMLQATNLDQFEKALSRIQVPFFNIIYADLDGHILYLFNRSRRHIGNSVDRNPPLRGSSPSCRSAKRLGSERQRSALDMHTAHGPQSRRLPPLYVSSDAASPAPALDPDATGRRQHHLRRTYRIQTLDKDGAGRPYP